MARAHEPVFAADEPVCPRCLKPLPLCICDEIRPVANRTALVILQHPQEQDRLLGTARLAAQQFTQATLRVGLSWPSLAKALGRSGRSETLGDALPRLDARRRLPADKRGRRLRPQGRGARRSGSSPCRDRGRHPARRDVEPGQDAVVAQCLAAQGQAHRAQAAAPVALWQTPARGAARGPVDPRGGGAGARPPGRPAGDRGGCDGNLPPHAGALRQRHATDARRLTAVDGCH